VKLGLGGVGIRVGSKTRDEVLDQKKGRWTLEWLKSGSHKGSERKRFVVFTMG